MRSKVAGEINSSEIRYAQCWEDADVLLAALDLQPGDVCLSIASAGDNTLALLTRNPARVVAIDRSHPQLYCLELRVAAYRALSHTELLELIGSSPSNQRRDLYQRCRPLLSSPARDFWDRSAGGIEQGIGSQGKLERYLGYFRRFALPLVHGRSTCQRLLQGGPEDQRRRFFDQRWNTWRWRLMFRIFFSRWLMSRLGRDREFFRYVQGGIADRLLARTSQVLTALDPAVNPYVQWILTGRHTTALPLALRPEHFDTIRANLDRLEWRHMGLQEYLAGEAQTFDRFNLSDIFEYMSEGDCCPLFEALAEHGKAGGRLVYWNLFVPRSRPQHLARALHPLSEVATALHAQDKAFFYSRLVIEEIAHQ